MGVFSWLTPPGYSVCIKGEHLCGCCFVSLGVSRNPKLEFNLSFSV